jgi:hypothetical protein
MAAPTIVQLLRCSASIVRAMMTSRAGGSLGGGGAVAEDILNTATHHLSHRRLMHESLGSYDSSLHFMMPFQDHHRVTSHWLSSHMFEMF